MRASTDIAVLPDPRRYFDGQADHPLLRLAQQGESVQARLRDAIRADIRQGEDAGVLEALRRAPSSAVYRRLWQALCAASDAAPGGDEHVVARLFAIPLVLVAGAKRRVVVPGAIPDIDAVCALLQQHAALGAMRNLGVGNALCLPEALERITPVTLFRWSTDFGSFAAPHDLGAGDMEVGPGREQVRLRFLVGAGIAQQTAAPFMQDAADIGIWGMPLTRLLVQQLAQPGLELLPIPRPPASILQAPHLGRGAELGLSFSLFVSNAVRQFRAAVGDPTAMVSAHQAATGGAEIRISLSSPFDDTMLEGFRWPLHPVDDFGQTLAGITGLLRECRVSDIRMVETLLPEQLAGGALFIRVADHADHAQTARGLAH